MSKQKIYTFLKDLSENNSKEWMDANRKRYHEAKQFWLEEISLILSKLAKHDSHFEKLAPQPLNAYLKEVIEFED